MPSINQLDALGRIALIIREYCRQTATYDNPPNKLLINAYLQQHLSISDWNHWQHLQPFQQAAFVRNSLPDYSPSLQQVEMILKQYKRAGYEYYQFWCQGQNAT